MSKESHFSFDNLGKEFASSLKFIQYALVCPFLRPAYPQHSSVAKNALVFRYYFLIKLNTSMRKIVMEKYKNVRDSANL